MEWKSIALMIFLNTEVGIRKILSIFPWMKGLWSLVYSPIRWPKSFSAYPLITFLATLELIRWKKYFTKFTTVNTS